MDIRTAINLVEGVGRLDELQGVKHHTAQPFEHKNDVLKYLGDQGFERLGFGVYGGVFDHPSFKGRYVLKVFADANYEFFLNWCMKQGGNKHLPRIVGKIVKLTDVGRMVRIERLDTLERAEYGSLRLGVMAKMIGGGEKPTDQMKREMYDFGLRNGCLELYTTLHDVAAVKPEGALIDLHPGNFMKRGSTIVVSDPYAGARIPFLKIY